MKSKPAGFAAALSMALLSAALPALAHHSFSAEFDNDKKVNLQGTVTKVDWLNPHIWIYLDVKDDKTGAVSSWQCEGGPPNTLTRNGWTKNDLKKGDIISVSGTLAKDASKTCNATSVKFPDGRTVFAGSSNPDAQKQ
jgi:Family of unknown function (DUF6152)